VGTGWWMKATVIEMEKFENLEIGIAWASDDIREYKRFEEGNIIYYLIPQHPLPVRKKNKLNRIWSHSIRIFNLVRRHKYSDELRDCVRAVNDFKPDLVHVWGTENFYGLISKMVNVPVLVKMQGLLSVIKDDYWGGVKWRERVSMPNEMLYYIDIRKRAETEIKILKQNRYFEGRTFWDHSHLREHNTSAHYYDIPEMMRPSFYESKWSIENIKKHSVYTTARSMPAKGNACLIQAISIVRQYVPDVQLRIGGQFANSGYGKFLKRMVTELSLDDCVTFLGPVSESKIINELLTAHVYVLSSYIENSCNSLIEAQMVGVPCAAAYVGGVTSLVTDQETGLLFHKGDSATLAMNIRKIFNDDALASKLSQAARKFTLDRYAKDRIVNSTLSVYKDILGPTFAD
jgi:glycosyltransferase involved in cell wall biosynthesis